ncbi:MULTISPECIES: hypothetical protein [Microbacterium]|uniref:hypothetical protein n=1 Tax=Microbacterium TaxID=33882 RepID=UPI0011BF4F03|nr:MULTISPECIES: hypothetical protein [unclassified Microbacterium]NYF29777.1 hypothetical protein [Microbacterium sp. JAI119]
MSDPAKPRRWRLDPSSPPAAVLEDRTKWPAWQRLWRRIMVRWALFSLAFLLPWGAMMLLAFNEQAVPEGIAIPILALLMTVFVSMMFPMRRWTRRELDDFARQELDLDAWP